MNKIKDPRQKVIFFGRLSLIIFFFIPLLFLSIKFNKMTRLIFLLLGTIVLSLLVKKYFKKSEGFIVNDAVITGFMFSGTWLFIATIFLTLSVSQEIFSKMIFLISPLIFFSLILFYFSNKSLQYEQDELKIKRKFDPRIIFLIFVILSLSRGVFFFLK